VADVAKVVIVKRGVRGIALLAVIAVGGQFQSAGAAPSSSESRVQTLRVQVEDASAEESALLGRIDEAVARRRALDGQVAAIDREITRVQSDLDAAQRRFDRVQLQVLAIEHKLDDARGDLAVAKDDLRRRALAAYMGHSDVTTYAELVLHSSGMRQLAASSGYMSAVLHAQRAAVQRHQQLNAEVTRLRDEVERGRLEAKHSRDVIAEQRSALEQRRQAADGLRQQARGALARQEQALHEIAARKNEFVAEIAALQATSDRLAALLRDRQASQTAARAEPGVVARPVDGPITSLFGPRVHPIFGDVRMHTGIDFGVSTGTPIHAADDGVVVIAGPYGGYGNATVIDHGNALATLYVHQSALLVARGQQIANVGCTGYCTGPHLHFEVRLYGTPVDPLGYL
jgi:murein DD-endopeptidase MepM/ murein hydrolase activator NlpD